ncbi:MAG TPA: nucleotidyltransferase family protein [Gaiellaceae bacterium]|jgi:hypothetical protein
MPADERRQMLWDAVAGLLATADLDSIVAHRLGSFEAWRRRQLRIPVPARLVREERVAAFGRATAVPLLERIRDACDAPLLLFKGPELARLYPLDTRPFGDLDLLTTDAAAVHRSLLAAGFQLEGADVPSEHHHLRPLRWPSSPLHVEVHAQPNWPRTLRGPAAGELFEASVPSSFGIEGVAALSPAHHAVICAVHGWQHRPLRVLRDLVDVAVTAVASDERELGHTATAWGAGRIWDTTKATCEALFEGARRPLSLRTWARSLPAMRPRGAAGIDAEALISCFWSMRPAEALAHDARLVRRRLGRRFR